MATVKKFQVTFDCAEPERVARFWCEVLGYVVPPPPPGFDSWQAFEQTLPEEAQALLDHAGVKPEELVGKVRSVTYRASKPESCCGPSCCEGTV